MLGVVDDRLRQLRHLLFGGRAVDALIKIDGDTVCAIKGKPLSETTES